MEDFQFWFQLPKGFRNLVRIADEFWQTQPTIRSEAATTMRIDNHPRCKVPWAFNQLDFAAFHYLSWISANILVSVDEEDVVGRRHSQLKKHFGCRCCFQIQWDLYVISDTNFSLCCCKVCMWPYCRHFQLSSGIISSSLQLRFFRVSELEERCKIYKSTKWRFSYSFEWSQLSCSLLDLLHIHLWLEVRLGDCLGQLAIDDCDFKFHSRSRDAKVTRVRIRDSLAL